MLENQGKSMSETEQSPVSQEHESTPVKVRKSRFRWLWRGLFVLLLLATALLAVLSTAVGQQKLLGFLADKLDALSIEQVEGSLQQGLTLKNARFQRDGVELAVGQADLHIGFNCLLDRKACVENLALRDTAIIIDTSKLPPAAPKEDKPVSVHLPLPVEVKRISLDNISVRVDETDVFLHHFHTGIQGEQNRLQLAPTQLQGLTLSLPPQAVENAEKSAKSLESSPNWVELEKKLAAPLLSKFKPLELPIWLDIPSIQARDIRLERKTLDKQGKPSEALSLLNVTNLELQGKSNAQTVTLNKLLLETDKGNVSGNGELKLAANYPLNWQLKAEIPPLAELQIPQSRADLSLSGELLGNIVLELKTQGAVQATLSGSVALSEPKTPFDLSLTSPSASYPFAPTKGSERLKLSGLALTLKGDLLNYQLNGAVGLSGMGVPNTEIKLDGKGGLTRFDLAKLSLAGLNGKAELNGHIDWKQGIEWQSNVDVANLHTQPLLPDWAAVLSGKLQSSGYAGRGKQGNEWAVALNNLDLNGTLFDKNLKLKGELTADHQTLLNVPTATLIYGENQIALKGVLGEKSDFSADINAPNLKGLVPHLQAGLNGKVAMKGKLAEPQLDLDLVANNVAYQQLKLSHLTAKGQIHTEKQIQADLNLALKQLNIGEIKVAQANLNAKGNEAQHHISLTSQGEPLGANLQISGKFDRLQQRWQGVLSEVVLQTELGKIQNDKAVPITYQHKTLSSDIGAHCWRHSQLQLCFPKAFQVGAEGTVPFEVKQLDLSLLQPYLDKNTQLEGVINAKGEAQWFKQRAPRLSLSLHSAPIKLKQRLDGQSFPLTLSELTLNAELKENNLALKTEAQIDQNGRLLSDIQLHDLAQKRNLSGSLTLDKLNLSLIKPLLGNGEKIGGEFNGHLTLGGNVAAPQLHGNLNLSGLNAQSRAMPFDIIDGGLNLHFNGTHSTLSGKVRSPESELFLSGEADWRNLSAWHTRIQAKADKFRLALPDLGKVEVSPTIEVKATPHSLDLNGNIDIPWARIEVQELPESAVSVSGDEIIMDGSAKNKRKLALLNPKNPPKNGQGMAINADISVNIGNDVRLEAYGLKTHLQGLLKVRQGNRGLGLYGQVNLKNGTFASFGQDLIIRKGLVSFTGLPSQPTLDIEAIRNPNAMDNASITAGVRASGLADNLDVKIFSDPSMSQDQALSYLLTGRGLDNNEGASGNSVAAALIGLGLSKSSKTVGSVGSAFGISDLNVSTEGIGDNTKVVVSGSLNSRLKVEYGVGLFAPLTELALRYRLAPNLYLQWVSGINQAVDLLYRFEFD